MSVDEPEHNGLPRALTASPALMAPETVTVAVLVNSAGVQPAAVARTLKVVFAVSTPVERFIIQPVPTTGDHIRLLSASFLS